MGGEAIRREERDVQYGCGERSTVEIRQQASCAALHRYKATARDLVTFSL